MAELINEMRYRLTTVRWQLLGKKTSVELAYTQFYNPQQFKGKACPTACFSVESVLVGSTKNAQACAIYEFRYIYSWPAFRV